MLTQERRSLGSAKHSGVYARLIGSWAQVPDVQRNIDPVCICLGLVKANTFPENGHSPFNLADSHSENSVVVARADSGRHERCARCDFYWYRRRSGAGPGAELTPIGKPTAV